MSLKIAVLVAGGAHPLTGARRAGRGDTAALVLGAKLGTPAVLHAGRADEPALPHYLALGAREIEVLELAPGDDAVCVLAGRAAAFDAVLTGQFSETGQGSGLFPYCLASTLGWPVISAVLGVERDGEEIVVTQVLPKGRRRRVAIAGPVVLAVHPAAAAGATYAFARQRAGRITVVPRAPGEAAEGRAVSPWAIVQEPRRFVRLEVGEKKTAHARLQGAIASPAKGGTVVSAGSGRDKAQALLDYLRANRLAEF